MNRQRDAEGENASIASRGQSDGEGVEAEEGRQGSLGSQREPRRESQGRRHVAKTRLIPQAWLHPLVFYVRRGEPRG